MNAIGGLLDRNICIKAWKLLAVLLVAPVLVLWFLVVHQNDEIIALIRNEVLTDAAGNRMWHGTFVNTDTRTYRDLATTIHFLDSSGNTVATARAEAAELDGGKTRTLQALLPPEAVNLRIYSMQWRNDRTAALMGPFREAWEFGYVMQ